jgi:putative transposase
MGRAEEPRPRKKRKAWNTPGHAHGLTFSCQNRWQILGDDQVKDTFLRELDRARTRLNFALAAYVVMPEHVHLLIKPQEPEYSMAAIFKAIKKTSSRSIIALLRQKQPAALERLRITWPSGRIEYRVWLQGGGYDRNIVERDGLTTAVDYIHLNPVRREFVERPTDWRWSSAAAYLGGGEPPIPVDFIDL